ncbi:MAG: glycoside hydrolase 5 family protein [Acidimicrobiales bacterium]
MAAVPEGFRLGVNYWPSESAMGWLRSYDPAVVRRDFRTVAAAGMDTVRIFLLWEDIQPTSATIDPASLDCVIDAADAAGEAGVELIVTLFTGHMSGVNWVPRWATGGEDGDRRFRVSSGGKIQPTAMVMRNWYSDPDVVDAQARLAAGVSAALAGHPAVWAWDLGNENSNCTIPPDADSADRWLERMTSVLRESDPSSLVTVGTHMEDLENDRRIGPLEASRWCDFVCMHGYPIYAEWSSGPTDEFLVPFLTELTGWLAGGAPVLFEEFGLPTALPGTKPVGVQVSEADAAVYTARTLDGVRDAGGIGALLWCYTDYAADLHAVPPLDLATHERSFGLWRADRTPKPALAEVTARSGLTMLPPPGVGRWLDIGVEEFSEDRRRQLLRLYGRYRER